MVIEITKAQETATWILALINKLTMRNMIIAKTIPKDTIERGKNIPFKKIEAIKYKHTTLNIKMKNSYLSLLFEISKSEKNPLNIPKKERTIPIKIKTEEKMNHFKE